MALSEWTEEGLRWLLGSSEASIETSQGVNPRSRGAKGPSVICPLGDVPTPLAAAVMDRSTAVVAAVVAEMAWVIGMEENGGDNRGGEDGLAAMAVASKASVCRTCSS